MAAFERSHDAALNGSGLEPDGGDGGHDGGEWDGDGAGRAKRGGFGLFGARRTQFEKRLDGGGGGGARLQRRRARAAVDGGGMDGVVVDLATLTFAPLEAKGKAPPGRSHAVVCALGGRVLVVGGQAPRDAAFAGRAARLVDGETDPMQVSALVLTSALITLRTFDSTCAHAHSLSFNTCPAFFSCIIPSPNRPTVQTPDFPNLPIAAPGARAGHGRGISPGWQARHEDGPLALASAPGRGLPRLARH